MSLLLTQYTSNITYQWKSWVKTMSLGFPKKKKKNYHSYGCVCPRFNKQFNNYALACRRGSIMWLGFVFTLNSISTSTTMCPIPQWLCNLGLEWRTYQTEGRIVGGENNSLSSKGFSCWQRERADKFGRCPKKISCRERERAVWGRRKNRGDVPEFFL